MSNTLRYALGKPLAASLSLPGLLLFALLFWAAGVVGQTVTVTLTPASSSPWTVPAGVTSITVQAWGGGGGGGGQNGNNQEGGGGGGGGYATRTFSVTPGQNINFSVGAGGAGGTNGNTASARQGAVGGNTTILGMAANGGGGGAGNNGSGGGGGTASGGTTNTDGTAGNAGVGSTPTSSTGAGGAGANGGAGGAGRTTSGLGNAGTIPGGGGSGGLRSGGPTNYGGGDGADGQIVITYCTPPADFTVSLVGTNPYCTGTGLTVNVSGSETGVDYELWVDAGSGGGPVATGITLPGTGGALDFTDVKQGGIYTVVATKTLDGCTRTMSGSATVTPEFNVVIETASTVACGGEITVQVKAGTCDVANLTGLQYSITWDAAKFEYVASSAGAGGGPLTAPTIGPGTITNTLQYSWTSASSSGVDVSSGNVLLEFKLKALIPTGSDDIQLASTVPGDLEATQSNFYVIDIPNSPVVEATVGIAPNVTISIDNVTVDEDDGNAVFTVSLSAATGCPVTFDAATSNVTATAGSDYTAVPNPIGGYTIPANTTSITISVPITDDNLVEPTETFNLTLSNVVNANAGTLVGVGTILDNDDSEASIVATTQASEPGTNGLFTVELSNPVSVATIVSYTVGGTATGGVGQDYAALSGTVTVPANATSATIAVTVQDDNIVETGGETVVVTLTGTNNAVTIAATPDDEATVTIADDDDSEASIVATAQASEPGTNGLFTVTLTDVSSTATVVSYTVGGTATGGVGQDYAALSGTVTIPANTLSATIAVTVQDDDIVETGGETVIVTLTGTDDASITVAASPNNEATVTIADDDDATVSIAATAQASEPGTNGLFTVTLTDVSSTATVVSYTVGGTATGGVGQDYAALSGTVTIPANTLSATIAVTVQDDDIVETGGETVIVTLTGTDDASITVAASPNNEATVTIADDDDATVSIAATAQASEPGTNGLFTVTLTDVSSTATVVSYTVGGTATGGVGQDYAALSGTVTIPANTLSATIAVTVQDDDIVETGGETVIVTLTGTDDASITVAASPNNEATVTIADDDDATVSIAATAQASEPGTNGLFTVTLTDVSSTATVVSYTVGGTATGGVGQDYAALSGTVTIPANTLSATIAVTVQDDDIVETGGETVIVTLTGTDDASITVAASPNNEATVTIADDDDATVSIAATAQASEPGTNGLFTVTLTDVSSTATVVSYTVGGTATGGVGQDYAALSGTVTIPANTLSATIAVTVQDDDIVETGGETVIVTLTGTDDASITVAASPNNEATVTIADDDDATVSIAATAQASEPGTNGLFTVTLTDVSSTATVVSYTVGGTATGGVGQDYAALSGTVTIPANTLSATIAVTVQDDDIVETGGETVIVTLTGTDDASITVAASPNNEATVTIADDDDATVSIAATAQASEPGTNGLFTVTLTDVSSTATVVSYTVGGTATGGVGQDYAALSGTVTIPANTLSATIAVTVQDDDIVETGGETVIVTLTGTDDASITVAASPNNEATVTIADDDDATVSIAATAQASEPGTNGLFTVTLTDVSSTATVVSYTVGGTATGGVGQDYAALSGTVTIPANTLSATIAVTVQDDDIVETGGETVIVTLTGTDDASITVAASPNNEATVTIADDDDATVSIAAMAQASEPGTNGLFTVTLTDVSSTATVVSYTVGGTATGGVGQDYAALSGTVTIPANTLSATIAVTVQDDDIVETGGETVIVTLTGTDDASITVAASPNNEATVTIADDDDATVSIAATAQASEPGTNGLFTVTLTDVSSTATVVSYTVGGTATGGVGQDYAALSGTVTIPANTLSATIAVTVQDDDIVETGGETVIVTLTGTDDASITVAASPNNEATVTIADDDDATVSIAATAQASEPGTNGLFTVTLTDVSSTATVVSYTVGGTATGGVGQDYAALSGTVTIPANTLSATIAVTVQDDDIVETGGETVIVTLTGTDDASITVAASPNNEATVTIADDDDATVSIAATAQASEPGTNGLFTVTLTDVSSTATVVSYTVGGTATGGVGQDYAALSGTVTIPANTLSATIAVTVQDDDIVETGGETVIVTLTGTDDASITVAASPNNEATVTIADDDDATVSIAATAQASEPGTNGLFTVTLTDVSSTATVVSYTVGGTATGGVGQDYAALSGTVTIPANTLSATIAVTVQDDDIVETGGETVIVTLTGTDDASITVAASPNNEATVTIADDDDATVSIAATAQASEPGTNGLFTVTLTDVSSTATVVSYTVGGTATGGVGQDYAALSGTVTIPANTLSATIAVTVQDDDIVETGGETVIVTLTGTDDASITVAASPNNEATVTIADDDDATVSIAATAQASEPGTNGLFTVTLTDVSSTATVVSYTVGGTATGGVGQDYAALSGTVTIPANTLSATIAVTVQDDDIVETGGETVIVTLTGTDDASITVAASPNNEATVTIADDDDATVSIAATAQASEPGTNGLFTVTLTDVSSTATVVSYTVGGTATGGVGQDYAALSGTVTIPANTLSATIAVTVQDDDIVETGGETVIVTLTGTDDASITVAASPNNEATVTIADDDDATVSIAATAQASEPGTNGLFTVTLTDVSSTATVVSYTVGGTATGGVGQDYAALSGTVTIPANTLSATIAVTVQDDDIVETGGETVIVTLTGTDDASITVAASPNNEATVTIADDDDATVSIAATAQASEPGTNGLFTVTLTDVSSTATVVSYTVGGTATGGVGQDYAALSGTVTIPANTLSATIAVTVQDDDIVETGGETVIVTLTGTDDASITVAAAPDDAATVTIADNDAASAYIEATTQASEPATNGLFTVSLTELSSTATVVSYSVGGTATAGTDYTALSGSVTIPANTASATITVAVIDDGDVETGGETVIVTLTGTDNAAIDIAASPDDEATVTIADDDFYEVTGKLTWRGGDGSGGIGVGQATVTLTGPPNDVDVTGAAGTFSLQTNAAGNFTITPEKHIFIPPSYTSLFNGVDVGDALAIQQHITGITTISDPFRLVAADANKSYTISTVDAAVIRQGLLLNPAALAILNNTKSWRFIPSNHTLTAPTPYTLNVFPETRSLMSLSSDVSGQDFWGVKVGDVLETSSPVIDPANLTGQSQNPLLWMLQDRVLQAGEAVEVEFQAGNFNDLAAFQFGLGFDPQHLGFEDVEVLNSALPLSADGNFGTTGIENGELRVAYAIATGTTLPAHTPVFKVRFTALSTGYKLSEVLGIDRDMMPAVAYSSALAASTVSVVYTETVTSVDDPGAALRAQLLQNRPNPFEKETLIGFVLPEACEAQLRVLDMSGRELWRISKQYGAGYNEELLRLDAGFAQGGVLLYELRTPYGVMTRKMVMTR